MPDRRASHLLGRSGLERISRQRAADSRAHSLRGSESDQSEVAAASVELCSSISASLPAVLIQHLFVSLPVSISSFTVCRAPARQARPPAISLALDSRRSESLQLRPQSAHHP